MAPDDSDDRADRADRASDAPHDLVKERETFVRNFLQKGVQFTEDLLIENARLRREVGQLRDHNARLSLQVKSDAAIRELLETIEKLEQEKNALLERSHELEVHRDQHQARYLEIEGELNDLANLYVASHQLHASLSVRRVVRHLRDTVGQLVGAEAFVIYAIDPTAGEAVPIGAEGLDGDPPPVQLGVGVVGEVCLEGQPRVLELSGHGSRGTLEQPIAVVPMLADGRPVGVIAIVSLLEQKEGWDPVDRELFKLLGAQAGTALISANLYARAEGPVSALAGLAEKL